MEGKDKIVELNAHAKNFLLFSYFGIEEKELTSANKENIAKTCAERAYFDLNRTLNFREKADKDGHGSTEKSRIEEEHKVFRSYISNIVIDHIDTLFKALKAKSNINFDEWHESACDSIITEAKNYQANEPSVHNVIEEEKFYYGQAQKWLNMTLKYMWLLGLWEEEFDKIKKHLHVPVDSYIIEHVWETDAYLPFKKPKIDRKIEKYSSEKVISWSKWDDVKYKKFQASLKKTFKFDDDKENLPLAWEAGAWIDAAKKRKEKEAEERKKKEDKKKSK